MKASRDRRICQKCDYNKIFEKGGLYVEEFVSRKSYLYKGMKGIVVMRGKKRWFSIGAYWNTNGWNYQGTKDIIWQCSHSCPFELEQVLLVGSERK